MGSIANEAQIFNRLPFRIKFEYSAVKLLRLQILIINKIQMPLRGRQISCCAIGKFT